jgi:hypothetical protein
VAAESGLALGGFAFAVGPERLHFSLGKHTMNKPIAILCLVASACSATTMLLLSQPLDRNVLLAVIWIGGAVMSLILGVAQIKSSRRLGLFCFFGGVMMLLFAAMLLPALRPARSYRQHSTMKLKFPPQPGACTGHALRLDAFGEQRPAPVMRSVRIRMRVTLL